MARMAHPYPVAAIFAIRRPRRFIARAVESLAFCPSRSRSARQMRSINSPAARSGVRSIGSAQSTARFRLGRLRKSAQFPSHGRATSGITPLNPGVRCGQRSQTRARTARLNVSGVIMAFMATSCYTRIIIPLYLITGSKNCWFFRGRSTLATGMRAVSCPLTTTCMEWSPS